MLSAGTRLGRYRILSLIKKGDTSEVYLAEDTSFLREVAIKVVQVPLSDIVTGEEMTQLFRREVRVLSRLEHPNILPLYDYGVQSGDDELQIFYIVMPFCAGGSLSDWLRLHESAGSLSVKDTDHLINQAAGALFYLHEQGFVHQGVNASNFFMRSESSARPALLLAGFNIAKAVAVAKPDSNMSGSESIAPEQMQGRPVPASDQYALAAMACELLTGHHLFSDSSPLDDPPSRDVFGPDTPEQVRSVLLRALSKDPMARYPSIIEFARAYHHALRSAKKPDIVFFSYAHKDRKLRNQLEEHLSILKYRGLITAWHDRDVVAGDDWEREIDMHLKSASIVLLLISASFMASHYCYSIEMSYALRRHERGEASVIPVLLRPVLFTEAPFARLQMLPANQKPVTTWRDRDSAFVEIALGIERTLQQREMKLSPPVYSQPSMQGSRGRHEESLPEDYRAYPQRSSYSQQPSYPQQPVWQVNRPRLPVRRAWSMRFVALIALLFLILLYFAGLLTHLFTAVWPIMVIILVSMVVLIFIVVRILLERREEQRREEQRREEQRRREAQRREEQRILLERREEQRKRAEQRREEQRIWEEAQQRARKDNYYREALIVYERALRDNSADTAALKGKGIVLDARERYDEALDVFRQLAALAPTSSIYARMGDIFMKMDRAREAVTVYEKAIECDKQDAQAYYGMGQALERLGETVEAERAFGSAKQLGYDDDAGSE
ncbi:MAG TPA: protein kinase [Ktedonobacteraceae bacterium]|jgi:serine/threonine protein kinase/Flp pilus assembly protein TadD|nr:protein kinase [Ktedonobacteraceae bacterium]